MRYDDSGIQQDEQAEGYEAARAEKNEILILIRPGEIQYVKRTWNTSSFAYCILYCPEYTFVLGGSYNVLREKLIMFAPIS